MDFGKPRWLPMARTRRDILYSLLAFVVGDDTPVTRHCPTVIATRDLYFTLSQMGSGASGHLPMPPPVLGAQYKLLERLYRNTAGAHARIRRAPFPATERNILYTMILAVDPHARIRRGPTDIPIVALIYGMIEHSPFGGGPVPPPFSPTDIPGLKLWLDASQITGLTNGAPVPTWLDMSGNGNNAVQPTVAAQPIYQTGVLNGLPIVRFDGVDDTIIAPCTVSTTTVFVVVRAPLLETGINGRTVFSFGSNESYFYDDRSPFPFAPWWYRDSTTNAPAGIGPLTTNALVTWQADPATFNRSWYNGVSQWDLAVGASDTGWPPTQFGLCARNPAAPFQISAFDIAEVIIYDSALSDVDRIKVEDYLNQKYNLGASFAPTDIAGLQLWLDASQITGLGDGDPVATWPDESGNGNNATQPSSGARPTYQTNEINGLPIIRFDGVDDELSFILTTPQPFTMFFVAKEITPAASGYGIPAWRMGYDSASQLFLYGNTGFALPCTRDTSPHLFGGKASAGNGQMYFDGGGLGGTSPTDAAWSGTSYLCSNGAGGFYQWDMAEFIIYDSALSDVDRQAVENYLAAKYGL